MGKSHDSPSGGCRETLNTLASSFSLQAGLVLGIVSPAISSYGLQFLGCDSLKQFLPLASKIVGTLNHPKALA